jgi:molybdenum cofactor biosynthesis enzyme MoaA
MRIDLVDIAKALYLTGCAVTLVSNGSKLMRHLKKGLTEYVQQFNVSLHTLDPKDYNTVCGVAQGLQPGCCVSTVENESSSKMRCAIDAIKEIRKITTYAKIHINTVILKDINDTWAKVSPLLEFAKSIDGVAKFIELFDPNSKGSRTPKIESSSENPGKSLGKLLESHGWKRTNFGDSGDFGGSGDPGSKRTTTYTTANGGCIVRIDKLSCAVAKESGDSCGDLMHLAITRQGMLKTCFMKNATIDLFPSINERNEKKLGELLLKGLAQIGKNCPLINGIPDIEDII